MRCKPHLHDCRKNNAVASLVPEPLLAPNRLERIKDCQDRHAWAQRDLNPRPSDYESAALTA